MKENNKSVLIVLLTAISIFLGILLIQSTTQLNNKDNIARTYFIQENIQAEISPLLPKTNEYRFTIQDIPPRTAYLITGPTTLWGTIPTEEYISLWQEEFKNNTPFALIVIYDEDNKNRSLVNIIDAMYDNKNNTLTYTLRMLSSDYGQSIGMSQPLTQKLPGGVNNSDIFIYSVPTVLEDMNNLSFTTVKYLRQNKVVNVNELYIKVKSALDNSKYNVSEPYTDSTLHLYDSISLGEPLFID